MKIAQHEGLVEDRDELRALNANTQKEIQRQTAEDIVDNAAGMDAIVETHAVIRTPFGYLPGIPRWTAEQLNSNRIMVIEADPDDIRSRRAEDANRDRTISSVAEIAEQQEVAREMISAAAMLSGAYMKLIRNRPGKVDRQLKPLH